MFTKHIPRTGSNESSSHGVAKKIAGIATMLGLGASFALAGPMAANAADVPHSYAEGQFLSGTIGGTNLANVIALEAAVASNNGTQDKQTSKDPLSAEVLNAINIAAAGGVQLNLGSFLDAGAVSQYAEASKDGSSLGASGAIGNDGAIGVGAVGSGAGSGSTTLDLDSLLGSSFASVLTDLKLQLDAVSAQAVGNLQNASGDYRLAGAKLTFTSPAIGDLTSKVNSALGPVDQALLDLGGSNGLLALSLNNVLNPLLSAVGSSANVTASITTDVHGAVASLLTGTYGNGAVSFDLQTGAVSVDLEQLLGGDLNNLPVDTEILSDTVINQVLKGITDTISTLADQIVEKVKVTLDSAVVDVHADLNVLTPQQGAPTQSCVQVPIVGQVTDPVTGLVGGLLGGLTGGATGPIQQLTKEVCTLIPTLLPDLQTSLTADIHGTIHQILGGTADQSTATLTVLGIPVTVNVNSILNGLLNGLTDKLFDSDGAVAQLVNSLNTGLVNPAVSGLLGNTSVSTALTDILSVRVNLQETHLVGASGMAVANGSMFTETAVRISALGLATINLAAATVGPNVTTVVDPGCTVNCGGNPGCTVNCGNPPPTCVVNCGSGSTTTSATDRLATTGVGIATLIAVILALLAAGAYLAREGYRKNHPQPLS